MVKPATDILLTPEEEQRIRKWIREAEKQQTKAERGRIVLLAAQRWSTQRIAQTLGIRPASVSKWRTRFARYGFAGLENAVKPGRPSTYSPELDRRILSLAGQPPPRPHAAWTGPLLAQVVGDVSVDYIWKVLRQHGISLRKQDPRECNLKPDTVLKSYGLTGLYLSNETSAFLIGVFDPATFPPGTPLRSILRLPGPEIAAMLKLRSREPPSLVEALHWAASLIRKGTYESAEERTARQFLLDARRHSPDSVIHFFPSGTGVLAVPGIDSHPIASFPHWMDRLRCYVTPICTYPQPAHASALSRLLAAVEDVVFAHRHSPAAPFEWHAYPFAAGNRRRHRKMPVLEP